jgi:hypothetical protein
MLHPLYTTMEEYQTMTLLSAVAEEFQPRSQTLSLSSLWIRRGNHVEIFGHYWELIECAFSVHTTDLIYTLLDCSIPIIMAINVDNNLL